MSRIRYPYTENETISSEAIETHTYSYENSQWGDVLTAYNEQPVLYDAMGNITSLNGDTYTWTGGRQLSRITKADNSYIDYFYDDNGQLSMYKMYDSDGALDGGAEYYWEGTKLIAVKLIENETETDGMSAFMRILYDAKDEPLGFLLNDAMPFLYTKNILGDITGVVYYETAEYLFRYAYDAYGNYKLIPADNSPAAEVMAIMFHTLNPLTYRGYVFAPAIGICHYLGSRFYSPMLCRFMNADIYADTAQGVVGTNMFAYCNNNPISCIDPEGTNPLILFGVPITTKFIVSVVVFLVSTAAALILLHQIITIIVERLIIFTEEQIEKAINSSREIKDAITKSFKNKLNSISYSIYAILSNLITDTVASIKTKYSGTAEHHIVAQNDYRAKNSRIILEEVGIKVNDSCNLVIIKKTLHVYLHTSMYHYIVEILLSTCETSKDHWNKTQVLDVLLLMKIVLTAASITLV